MTEETTLCLPDDFLAHTRRLMGDDLFAKFCTGMRQEVPVSIRLNRTKGGTKLEAVSAERQVPWCDDGFYLQRRPNFTFDPMLHTGMYYVQEASSMFLHHVLRQCVIPAERPLVVLDMCAAPGGKSIAALSAFPSDTLIVSNEPIRSRAQVLAENLHKWGSDNAIVTNNYPKDFLCTAFMADVVLCDVPCSGEGMFRKDKNAVGEWSADRVAQCSALQREIVSAAWEKLRPGGLMVYSTCTLNEHEDEENVAWICQQLGAEPITIEIQPEWGIVGSLSAAFQGPVYRFLPGVAQGEGLFMAALRKPTDDESDASETQPRNKKAKKTRKQDPTQSKSSFIATCQSWIAASERYEVVTVGDNVYALPKPLLPIYLSLSEKLNVLKAGITLAQVKGRDVLPSQSLALSAALKPSAFPHAELSHAEAIAYLRKESITLSADVPKGFVVVTRHGRPLGFVKNLGTRANNLYPQEWRIKSTHIPEEEKIIKETE